MRRPSLPAAVAAVALVAALAGCITPSIPIPPPSPERMTFDVDVDAGVATFAYPADPEYVGAVVYVFNRTAGGGVITTADADGAIGPTAPFPAAYGDEVAVTIEADAQTVSICVVLREGASPIPTCD